MYQRSYGEYAQAHSSSTSASKTHRIPISVKCQQLSWVSGPTQRFGFGGRLMQHHTHATSAVYGSSLSICFSVPAVVDVKRAIEI